MKVLSSRQAPDIGGLKVFVVEDESLIAMQLEDILADLGTEVVGMAMKVSRALDMIAGGLDIQVAVLDVNIGGEKIYPVAFRLRELGVPIVFATGYGRSGVDPEWHDCAILQKPYTAEQVQTAIEDALA